MCLASTIAEIIWISSILTRSTSTIALSLWCDNTSEIALSENHILYAKTKHIIIDYHFMREKILTDQFSIQYVFSNE